MTALYITLTLLVGGMIGAAGMAILTGCRDRGLDDDDIDRIAGIVLGEMRRNAPPHAPYQASAEEVMNTIRTLEGNTRPVPQGEHA